MNAVEFVRKFGIERVKKILTGAPESANSFRFYNDNFTFGMYGRCNSFSDGQVSLDDLKHIVEAFDLVKSYGGLACARDELNNRYIGFSTYQELQHSIKIVEKVNASD